jgi:hypothetical protein
MSLDQKYLIITEVCSCNDNSMDPASAREIICLECFGRGTKSTKISLAELKVLLNTNDP